MVGVAGLAFTTTVTGAEVSLWQVPLDTLTVKVVPVFIVMV
jgi:hypothetical protein